MRLAPWTLLLALAFAPVLGAEETLEGDVYRVVGRGFNLVGKADAASQGRVGREDLAKRPLLRPGELVETVPGVVISQHSGDGKANQYYARGFNLDHGTDFAAYVDGLPVNMRTHGHGQGYSDLNFLIPELVDLIAYEKGPYSAHSGDFSAVGEVHFDYIDRLPGTGLLSQSVGEFQYTRSVFGMSPQVGPGTLLYVVEAAHNDGPWEEREGYRKLNAVVKYSLGEKGKHWSLTAMDYEGQWTATNQVPRRAIDAGTISRFGTLDPTDGGVTYRRSIALDGESEFSFGSLHGNAYAIDYGLNLISNPTFFTVDNVNGDQIDQEDRRWVGGGKFELDLPYRVGGCEWNTELGLETRFDNIWALGLYGTARRQRLSTLGKHQVAEGSVAAFVEQRAKLSEWARLTLGGRADNYQFKVDTQTNTTVAALNSGNAAQTVFSPKANLAIGPFAETELYLSYGESFHSNDARGILQAWADSDGDGNLDKVDTATPLVKVKGSEVGLRSGVIDGLQSTLAVWQLDFESELVFIGDAQVTEPGRPSSRWGLEFANYYSPTRWLTLDADYSWSYGRYTKDDPAGNYIPGSLEDVLTLGTNVEAPYGLTLGLRGRYFGSRPLLEDNSIRSSSSFLWNFRFGYRPWAEHQLFVEIYNVFNANVSDVEYWYESQMAGESSPVEDIHLHAAEPRSLRVTYTLKF